LINHEQVLIRYSDSKSYPHECRAFWYCGVRCRHLLNDASISKLDLPGEGDDFDQMNTDAGSCSSEWHQQASALPVVQAPEQRLVEICDILAVGLMRLRARKSSQLLPTGADFFLGSLARQSGAVAEVEGDGP
jgi:hypothetical protein